jgi:hypothetical protein
MITEIAALVSAVCSVAAALGGLMTWIYQRGQAVGRDRERLERLETEMDMRGREERSPAEEADLGSASRRSSRKRRPRARRRTSPVP